ncbi:HdeD family acid-resistance protein [Colwellia echini]|uniref:HdeD family acid-resistance protein n=1 Tax=Colwellia echini TaxID=1982103 RepID=A0ABY3N1G9_9GAMM|nr:DUF308 domain-containing protein [Colwellia echini]TYK67341.1 hypothetical protein CWS31_002120 [Colwellia echini]
MTDIVNNSEKSNETAVNEEITVTRETQTQMLSMAFARNTKMAGIVMIVIGLLGILVPNFIGIAFNTFVGGIFLLAALALAFNAWHTKNQNMSLWFRPFVLTALGLIIFIHPGIILGVLGLLIAIYFLISGFSSMVFAFELKSSAKLLTLLNGAVSFVLGVIVLDSWPFASAWVIGLIIGVTFLFDGISLLSIANQVKSTQEKVVN